MPKVSINIVTWNSLKYLPECFDSIFNQTFKDFSVLVIDNASVDKSVKFIEKKYPQTLLDRESYLIGRVRIIHNSRNLGFAKAHNKGIIFSQGDYILVTNPDIVLTPNCLENLIREMEKNPKIGCIGGKLLKIKPHNSDLPYIYGTKTDIIDSTGLKILKSRKVIDRGQGEKDKGQFDKKEEVFGISGALALYRRKALEDIKLDGEYFDNSFFSYKEDIDLSWRLRLRGWKNFYTPEAVAYHYRGIGIGEKAKLSEILKKRKSRPKLIKYYSYKNHLTILTKNEFLINIIRHFPYIFWYEFKKFIYILLLEISTLKGFFDFLKDLPKVLKKRKTILAGAKVEPKEIKMV